MNPFRVKGFDDNEARGMYSRAFQIAWPATIEGMLLAIINAIDSAMVSKVDKYAMASIGLTSQPRMILLILAQALCIGTTALVARRKGEDDRQGANSVLSQSILLITGIGVTMSLLGYFFAVPIMQFAGADADTELMSVEYFQIICLGLCLNCWNLCICAALRAVGNTNITMVTNITANVVNVVLNYCLIGGHFGFPALGVQGAALATVIGSGVGCAISLFVVTRDSGYLKLRISFKFDRRTLSGLSKVGLSSMAENVALRIGFFINSRMIAGIGADALTSYTIVMQVTSLSFCLGDGIATAGSTMVGQSLGAQRKDKAQSYVGISMKMAAVVSAALMILLFVLKRDLAHIFTDSDVIISGASLAFIVVIFGIVPQNARVVFSGCLRGAGDVRYVAVCALISVAVLRPILTYLLCYPLNEAFPVLQLGYTGPWMAFVIDAFVRTLLLYRRIHDGRYLNIKL